MHMYVEKAFNFLILSFYLHFDFYKLYKNLSPNLIILATMIKMILDFSGSLAIPTEVCLNVSVLP